MTAKVTVIGSINMDLVSQAERFPDQGETLLGTDFQTIPGGKGANQAVAASKLGAEVTMVGCVGDDTFGQPLVTHLKDQGIFNVNVEPVTHAPTGVAQITVAEQDNTIIVVPGANAHVTPEIVKQNEKAIQNSDILLLQFEIPLESVEEAVNIANQYNTTVVLNPAPMQPVPLDLLEKVDFLTPNEHELTELLDTEEKKRFNEQYREKFFVTQGSAGVQFVENGNETIVPSYNVDVKDTTGAGDTFNGGFSVALAEGQSYSDACRFGNAAAAISVSQFGAQTGMPEREDVLRLLDKESD
ncbi:ribokinase [Alkalibacillus haloalkaliphilus]|uniref:Ribokinase n=1 Tax=Alkalibacillus haloalkaliphilus TaxID=94136 RepID=A0A511WBG7_9BACI|nr:ribokinase [Alkalibacillus haloalkaliphilus]GEN46652.1 ribokinase [Alkalibacillus haloalkaliphilus]